VGWSRSSAPLTAAASTSAAPARGDVDVDPLEGSRDCGYDLG
jgi:hypothetical protein